jgi:ABC-type nitrate/sulfonate/bicarbonate transport system substrate-binding protein
MAAALRAGDLDVAVLLTEGAVAGIADSGGFKIVSLYTESPLVWGIHVPATSRFAALEDLRGARYAISRRGSGSHLMSFVHARAQRWPIEALEFVTVRNLDGAIAAFAAGTADVFFWEKFMTKPLVDAGKFRRIGEFVAPWPAFVVCVAERTGAEQRTALVAVLHAVFAKALELVARPDAAAVIGERYALEPGDVAAWLAGTRWASKPGIAVGDLDAAVAALRDLGLIGREFQASEAIAPLPQA